MKAKVIKTFKDYRNQIITKGSYIEVEYDRAIKLSKQGLIICKQEDMHKEDMMQKLANKIETNDIEIAVPEKETKEVKKRRRKKIK